MSEVELVLAFLAGVVMGGALDRFVLRSSSMRGSTDCAGMGDERGDDADQRRADVYSSARIGAAAALTIVLVVLLVLDVAVPDYDISPGSSCVRCANSPWNTLRPASTTLPTSAEWLACENRLTRSRCNEPTTCQPTKRSSGSTRSPSLGTALICPEEQSDVIHAVYERIVIEGPRFVSLASHRPPTGMDWRSRCPMLLWRARQDSNLRPSAPEA